MSEGMPTEETAVVGCNAETGVIVNVWRRLIPVARDVPVAFVAVVVVVVVVAVVNDVPAVIAAVRRAPLPPPSALSTTRTPFLSLPYFRLRVCSSAAPSPL